MAGGLRGRGHEVSVVASNFPAGENHPADVLLQAGGATRAGRYTRFLNALDAHLDNARHDVVHAMLPVRRCDVYHPHAGIAAESVASGHLKYDGALRRTLARTANGLNLRRQRFARVERVLLTGGRPPVVLCLSEYVKRVVRRHYELPEQNLATLFNAVDLHRFDPAADAEARSEARGRLGIGPEKVLGLMIAQDFARKGLREAILATGRLSDTRFVLVVVGRQEPGTYRELAQRTGVSDQVIFAGPTPDPYAFYRAADFFVLPTKHDPCSLVVLESLAMGVPVISTAFNGACEIMREGVHGFVLPDPADVDALAGRMRNLLDRDARSAMSLACLELRPRLSYEHHLEELSEIYRGIASGRAT